MFMTRTKSKNALRLVASLAVFFCSWSGAQSPASLVPVPVIEQSHLGAKGFFYVGGQYTGEKGKEILQGQMYVEVLVPKVKKRPYPLVLFHGAGQTATNWMGTPDGRKGWADFFVEQGYIVYMVDQPMRGRSAWHPQDGAIRMFTAANEEFQFTAGEITGTWPNAELHTQWLGDGPLKGRMGDPVFDQFYASQVETVVSNEETERRIQLAGAALLDKIGPAILLTHSQAGPFGWLIADSRPQLVKGIVAVEPSGPPFELSVIGSGKARSWGPTDIPITYSPEVKDPSELTLRREKPEYEGSPGCLLQTSPAKKLINLEKIPVMMVAAQASYHQVYDHCTAHYLEQAGVHTDYFRLQDHGIMGNGHMVMIEKNSLQIAQFIDEYVARVMK